MNGASLERRIRAHQARIAVVGQGYVGLPLAVAFAEEGFPVVGLDVDEAKVAGLCRGHSHIDDVPSQRLQSVAANMTFTADFGRLREADVVIVCVPTPLSKSGDPDISYIVSATVEIASCLMPEQLVVLESTTYPGTTVEVIQPRLETEDRRAGHDFFLAFSPERIDPGNPSFHVRNTAKVVGGVTQRCGELAGLLYQQILDRVVTVSNATTAEMAKILENTFRAVNIGLVNEVAMMCDRMGIDVWEVIDAAATKPFGFLPFYPGPGLGGHCIPIDPFYLSWKMRMLDSRARFIELAGEINSGMPHFVVEKVRDALNDECRAVRDSRILLVGVAYKRNVSDVRESPAFDIATGLHGRGAQIEYHDPHVPKITFEWGELESTPLTAESLARADCVVVVTDHALLDLDTLVQHARLVVDTRNALRGHRGPARIIKL